MSFLPSTYPLHRCKSRIYLTNLTMALPCLKTLQVSPTQNEILQVHADLIIWLLYSSPASSCNHLPLPTVIILAPCTHHVVTVHHAIPCKNTLALFILWLILTCPSRPHSAIFSSKKLSCVLKHTHTHTHTHTHNG